MKKELKLLIKTFLDRKEEIVSLRDEVRGTSISDQLTRAYLRGGIDTLDSIIKSLERRYEKCLLITE